MLARPVFAVLAVLAFAAPAFAADQDFQIVNRTGYQIDEVYVGASTSRSWGKDLMGRGSLEDGAKLNVSFPNRTTACSFDIKVVYNDGDEAEWSQVNLCQVSKVNLYWRNGATRAVTE